MELDLVPGVDLGPRGGLRRDNLGGRCGLVVVGCGLLRAAGAEASDHDRGRGVAFARHAARRRGTGAVAPAPARARAGAGARWFTHGGRGTVGGMVVNDGRGRLILSGA